MIEFPFSPLYYLLITRMISPLAIKKQLVQYALTSRNICEPLHEVLRHRQTAFD